jgi:hypothetical protein
MFAGSSVRDVLGNLATTTGVLQDESALWRTLAACTRRTRRMRSLPPVDRVDATDYDLG